MCVFFILYDSNKIAKRYASVYVCRLITHSCRSVLSVVVTAMKRFPLLNASQRHRSFTRVVYTEGNLEKPFFFLSCLLLLFFLLAALRIVPFGVWASSTK